MQEYFTAMSADTKIQELNHLREEMVNLKDTLELILHNLSMLEPDFDASNKPVSPNSKKTKAAIKVGEKFVGGDL